MFLSIISQYNYSGDFMAIFTAVLHKEEDMFVAECVEIGIVSQGKTIEEALTNLKEATELYLEDFPLEKEPKKPFMTTFEVEYAGA